MKTYSVYELYDELGSIRYVGCSSNPKRRLKQHKQPTGKFYGWEMTMDIVKEFTDRKEALLFEGERKKYWGMEWEEKIGQIIGGKIRGKKTGKVNGLKRSIPTLVYTTSGQFVAEYPSQIEAARQFEKLLGKKVNLNNIRRVINGTRKTAYGHIFKEKLTI